ncbi:hypothetical protein [Clostridium algidicarnis]|uniref:hypothetical protein n=1 Tax=Clostridium algidicarnis TaxID=37659 RepID=UPI001C0E52D8|nr:hypothetical protein [Clostridium algidicarnis]MBU3210686.1 hypothetical protein [Clostridium algidicarnis]MBU3229137.1 hypothetical protein [Clostridium algidicarnis]MBU3252630.1 hypothetical protein [Clostridium algidicarnis]
MFKKKNNIILILLSVIITTFFLGCTKVSETEPSNFPLTKEVGNYIFDIEYTKYFGNYLLTKYYITTKDGSNIEDGNVFLSAATQNDNVVELSFGPQEISSKKIANDKLEVVQKYIIAGRKERSDQIKIEYLLTGDIKFKLSSPLNKSTNGYEYIHKKISLDGLDFTIESLGNFEFGSLIDFYIEDTKNSDTYDIREKYNLKLISGNYINAYELKALIAFPPKELGELEDYDYNKDSKYVQFYAGNLLYNPEDVDINNMQIYLVDKETQNETLIYSK